jgi:sugar fermentation stimulation protein A
MQYNNMQKAIFLRRPNRFIAHIEVDGREEVCHVKNTGRCRELLTDRATIYVQHHDDPKRKTKYSLIAVEKGKLLVNMDSQAPNKVVGEWLLEQEPFGKVKLLKPECTYGSSRFDFYLKTETEKFFIEVKGVTLEEDGIVRFPDAPTERGVKHLQELCACKEAGYKAAVIFVVQMEGMKHFEPNDKTHPQFGEALRQAQSAGVEVLAYECKVTPDSLVIDKAIPVKL